MKISSIILGAFLVSSMNQIVSRDNDLLWYEDFFDSVLGKKLACDDVSATTDQFIRGLQQELGMEQYRIRIKKMTPLAKATLGEYNAGVIAWANLMLVNEEWLDTLPLDEKRALIGHELIHLKKHHARNRLVLNFISGVAPLGFVILPWYSRRCEREADKEAAQKLKCARGGAKLFSRLGRIEDMQQRRNALKKMLSTHPDCEERVKYLQNMASKQEKQVLKTRSKKCKKQGKK